MFNLTTVIDEFKNDYNYITNDGSKFVFQTNAGAPNSRLVTFDFDNPEPRGTMTTLGESYESFDLEIPVPK